MEFREPCMVVAVGFMGVGKTYTTTNETVNPYTQNGPDGWKARPVLVFDPNAEESYQDYKSIDFDITEKSEYKRAEQIMKVKAPGKYKILPYKKNRQPMSASEMVQTVCTICKFYRNGLLILEDINKYTGYSYKQDMVGMLIGLRHLGVDLILHFQNLRFVPTRVWANMTYLRWHKQSDPIFKYKDRISNFELFSIAEQIVEIKYQTDQYYYLYINTLKNKLLNVSQEDFRQGAINYLEKNQGELNKLINQMDIEGKKKYTNRKDAISMFIDIKSKQYLS